MKILVALAVPPWPLNNGGALRESAVIRCLAESNEVVFSCPLEGDRREAVEKALAPWVSRFVWVPPGYGRSRGPPPGGPRLARAATYLIDVATHPVTPYEFRRRLPHWADVLVKECATVDAAYCRPASLAPVLRGLGWRRIVVDADDLRFLLHLRNARAGQQGRFQTLFEFVEGCRTWAAEQALGFRCGRMLVSSTEDARRVLANRVTIVPNGIDLATPVTDARPEDSSVLFVGHCGWDPNRAGLRWFIEEVWPLVLGHRPGSRLQIVGRDATLEQLPFAARPEIALAADVPAVMPWYQRAGVVVAPILFAAGTRIKILEALGYGVPVISTSVGAAGLTGTFSPSQGLYIRDRPADMASVIAAVLADPRSFRSAAAAGAECVRARFAWDSVLSPLREGLPQWVTPRHATAR